MIKKKWDVFISHASEDKEDLVRELADKLTKIGVKVWYDEFSLKLGDSLIDSINLGLSQSEYGILVVSPSFFNKKWTDIEYKSLLIKEEKGKKSILPIWHNMNAEKVSEFSLYLADKKSLDTSINSIEKISMDICEIVRPDIIQNIRLNLIYKELLKSAEKKIVNTSDLKAQTKQQSKLSESQICRAKNIFFGMGKYSKLTIEESIYNYELDLHPDREIQIWEMMNVTYLEFIEKYNISEEVLKLNIHDLLIGFSLRIMPDKLYLNNEQLSDLKEMWESNNYAI